MRKLTPEYKKEWYGRPSRKYPCVRKRATHKWLPYLKGMGIGMSAHKIWKCTECGKEHWWRPRHA